jgi:hypothetical protein
MRNKLSGWYRDWNRVKYLSRFEWSTHGFQVNIEVSGPILFLRQGYLAGG